MSQVFFWTDVSSKRNELTARYEPVQPFILLQFMTDAHVNTFFDVGANVGFYSLFATLAPTVNSIFSFEADSDAYREMKKNISLNGKSSLVHCTNAAVSSSRDRLEFGVSTPLSGINSVKSTTFHSSEKFEESRMVKALPLDWFCASQSFTEPIAIKIDVEGHEEHVLRGAQELLMKNPCLLQIEIYDSSLESVNQFLEKIDYQKIFSVRHDYYYSNIPTYFDRSHTLRLIENAMSTLVDYNLGKWPVGRRLVDMLEVSATLSRGVVSATMVLNKYGFQDDPEYAFYLLADGKKVAVSWYTNSPTTKIAVPDAAKGKSLSVKGFARSKNHPNKKISKAVKVNDRCE